MSTTSFVRQVCIKANWPKSALSGQSSGLIDIPSRVGYASTRPGRPGAAEPFEPRQDRKIATVRKCFWVPPVTCPDIVLRSMAADLSGFQVLWQNKHMPRWLAAVIAVFLGLGAGLYYGLVINPFQLVDTTPASLRSDYRTDYVLMIAEAYHTDQNADLAARRLSIFGGEPPAAIAAQAVQNAGQLGYAARDISLLQELTTALQAVQPIPTLAGGTP